MLLRAVVQLGFHQKPVGFLNIAEGDSGSGFYDHLLKFFDTCVDAVSAANAVARVTVHDALQLELRFCSSLQGFVRPRSRGIALSDVDPSALLDAMEQYEGTKHAAYV